MNRIELLVMRVAIGADVVREFRLFFLRSLYDNLAINVPPMSTLLHGAATYGIDLSSPGCVLERTDSRTDGSLGGLGSTVSDYRNCKVGDQ